MREKEFKCKTRAVAVRFAPSLRVRRASVREKLWNFLKLLDPPQGGRGALGESKFI